MIVVDGDRVSVAGKRFFSCIAMERFLDALAERVAFNDAAWKVCERLFFYFFFLFLTGVFFSLFQNSPFLTLFFS
jgi:hypothetical protein